MTDVWRQYNIEFADRATAEHVAAIHLGPVLHSAQGNGLLHGWWFVRKQPWKLRYMRAVNDTTTITDLLNALTEGGQVVGWARGIYEPETRVFGGEKGMDIAHALFHHDSHHLLVRGLKPDTRPALGQRETTVLLCSAMLRGACLDWYEQGDVWAKVSQLRTAAHRTVPTHQDRLVSAIRRLLTVDARGLSHLAGDGPLAGFGDWVTSFERAGQGLADLARHGLLDRGLRAVLAHHIIFHANRAGLPAQDLAALAALALTTVFAAAPGGAPPTTTVPTNGAPEVTTLAHDQSEASADQLRDDLTDRLRNMKVIHTTAVEAAFRKTPRHVFLPGVSIQDAYADSPVYTKHDGAGASISAASQPWMVAAMLEQLDAQPGHCVMEAGAGTGYNAAIIGAIVGETGRVVTVDIDIDLVEGARRHLMASGVGNVEVVLGDGALGYPSGAPYDRIIATVGVHETPTTWLDQIADAGRIVVPLRLRGTNSRSIVFERHVDRWTSVDSRLAVFMPLRGIGDDARRLVTLTPEQDVTLQTHKDQSVAGDALRGVLDTSAYQIWTGVLFPPDVPFEWLELWLCLRLENALMRMNVKPEATGRGQVTPMFPWGSMATTHDSDLAYLTIRPALAAADGSNLYEVGVIAHGPTSDGLAQQVADEIKTWHRDYRSRNVRFEMPDVPEAADQADGRFLLDRPHHPIIVIWE
jgi:protein-L-isoaspartate(D-aspartate) O-methyltransferase